MQTLKSETSFEIGVITYSFDIEIGYYDNGEDASDDYPSCSELDFQYGIITSQIHDFNDETGEEYYVTDENEIKMVTDWIEWTEELERGIA
jgi:hypothetical protein